MIVPFKKSIKLKRVFKVNLLKVDTGDIIYAIIILFALIVLFFS